MAQPSITAVRLSADLVARAKAEAALQSRSIAGQVEHWARLGMALETLPSARVSEVRALLSPSVEAPAGKGPRRR